VAQAAQGHPAEPGSPAVPAIPGLNLQRGPDADEQYVDLIMSEAAKYKELSQVLARIETAEDARGAASEYAGLAGELAALEKKSSALRPSTQYSSLEIRMLHGGKWGQAQIEYVVQVLRIAKIDEAREILALQRYPFNESMLDRIKQDRLAKERKQKAREQKQQAVADTKKGEAEWKARFLAAKAQSREALREADRARPQPTAADPGAVARSRAQGADGPSSDDPVARTLDDLGSPVPQRRDAARQALEDPAQAAAVARFLGTSRRERAMAMLRAMGPQAEPAVIPCLRSDNWFARKDACQVLKTIGTQVSVAELTVIAGNNGMSAMDARDALLAIARRTGSLDRKSLEPGPGRRNP
jgi:hypothetical protein